LSNSKNDELLGKNFWEELNVKLFLNNFFIIIYRRFKILRQYPKLSPRADALGRSLPIYIIQFNYFSSFPFFLYLIMSQFSSYPFQRILGENVQDAIKAAYRAQSNLAPLPSRDHSWKRITRDFLLPRAGALCARLSFRVYRPRHRAECDYYSLLRQRRHFAERST